MEYFAEVILPVKFGGGTFTYKVDSYLHMGVRVRVTLRRRELIGVVKSVSENKPDYKVLSVLEIIDDEPIMLPSQLQLVCFAADYYADSIGNIFKSILPPIIREDAFSGLKAIAYKVACEDLVSILNGLEKKPAQYRAMLYFAEHEKNIVSRKELIKNGISHNVLKSLVNGNILEKTEIAIDNYGSILSDLAEIDIDDVDVKFSMTNSEQISFIEQLSLHYAEKKGRYVLVLLPAIDESLLQNLSLDDDVITYFPSESPSKRANTYLRLLKSPESVRLIIGSRISVFLPLSRLGHIVVIDEHDERYKGMRSPVFNARDMAVMLGKNQGIGISFLSSSPTLESINCVKGKIFNFENLDKGYPVKVLEKGSELLSKYSRERMTEVLSLGRRVLVFQNRRGYAGSMECSNCGNIPSCPRCNARLGFHASARVLKCHYCGYMKPFLGKCDICGHDIVTVQGYGTERMASTLSSLFPEYKVSILDSDQNERFDSKANIIVGTSYMIRHDSKFDNIGLVLVANADNLLCSTDFRTTEKAFRTVMTLRFIARENQAEYIVQTKDFRQPVFKCLEDGDFMKFYEKELSERKEMNFPPFSRLMRLEFRHIDTDELHDKVNRFHAKLIQSVVTDCQISPVFDPDVDKIDMEYITQIVIRLPKTRQGVVIKKKILELLEEATSSILSKLKLNVEVDPQ